MLKKDLILRQLEEFGKVMAVILSFKKVKDWDNFEKEIREAALKFTTFEIDNVESLTETNFEKEILKHPNLKPEQLKILAELLFERLNFYAEKNEEDNYNSLKIKCIALYTHLQNDLTENEFDMNVHYKLQILKK